MPDSVETNQNVTPRRLALLGAKPARSSIPDVFLIGAMRSGTTTLCADLATHPRVDFGTRKEPWILTRAGGDAEAARRMYTDLYRRPAADAVLIDGSTSYAMRPEYEGEAALAFEIAPEARIVYVVRNPVHRAVSHFLHLRAMQLTDEPDIDRAVATDGRIIAFGRYAWQLAPWIEQFGAAAVNVVVAEEYQRDRLAGVRAVGQFLEVDVDCFSPATDAVLNASDSARIVTAPWRRILMSELYNRRIRPVVPARIRRRIAGTVLASPPDARPRPSPATVEAILSATRADQRELAKLLGRSRPIWDEKATLAAYR